MKTNCWRGCPRRRRIANGQDKGKLAIRNVAGRRRERLRAFERGQGFIIQDGRTGAVDDLNVEQAALPVDVKSKTGYAEETPALLGIALEAFDMGDRRD
jgi:hypothetical protein